MMTIGRAFPFLRGVLWSQCVGLAAGCFGRTTMDASPNEFDEPEVTSPAHLPEAEPRPRAVWGYKGLSNQIDPKIAALDDGVVMTAVTTDSRLFPGGSEGVILTRFAHDGAILWSRELRSCMQPAGVAVGSRQRIFVACVPGDDAPWLLRFDSRGNQEIRLDGSDEGRVDPGAIVADGEGSVYVAGGYTDPNSQGGSDLFVVRYDEDGNRRWMTIVNHDGEKTSSHVALSALTLVGQFGVATGGPFQGALQGSGAQIESLLTTEGTGPINGFVAGVAANGRISLLRRLGGSSDTTVLALAGLSQGDLLVYGNLQGTTGLGDLDVAACSQGSCDYLARLDAQGRGRWAFPRGKYHFGGTLLVEPGETRFYVGSSSTDTPTTFEVLSPEDGSTLMTAKVPSGEPNVTSMALDSESSLWVAGEARGDLDLGNGNVFVGDGPILFLARYDRAAD